MKANKKVTSITSKEENLTQWYTDVCLKAELMDYAQTKGFIVYRPDGFAIWESIQDYFNKKIKALGVRNVYLPSLIPMNLLNKEKEHVQGFAPECAVVTMGGNKTLSEPMVVRPTSETLFCDHFKDILHSYHDLPIKYNQWCSVVRWEKTTRPFLRGSEFLWQEGHTLHYDEYEARDFTLTILRLYSELGRDLLAIPFVAGRKPASERFAGACDTYTIEALMPDCQALQCGTSHYLGTGFSEAYNIRFADKNNEYRYPHYTSWGFSTRLLGALIMVHGDDEGLVLPPKVAPTQVVIIPIRPDADKSVMEECKKLESALKEKEVRVILDTTDKNPGWKFSQYEMKGVPLRVAIGPKDLDNDVVTLTRRFDGASLSVKLDTVADEVVKQLDLIHDGMYNKALKFLNEHIVEVHSFEELGDVVTNGKGFAKLMSSGDREEELKIKEAFNATPRVIPFDQMPFADTDPITGKKAEDVIYYARAY